MIEPGDSKMRWSSGPKTSSSLIETSASPEIPKIGIRRRCLTWSLHNSNLQNCPVDFSLLWDGLSLTLLSWSVLTCFRLSHTSLILSWRVRRLSAFSRPMIFLCVARALIRSRHIYSFFYNSLLTAQNARLLNILVMCISALKKLPFIPERKSLMWRHESLDPAIDSASIREYIFVYENPCYPNLWYHASFSWNRTIWSHTQIPRNA